ncbi:glycosyltransferase [Patescibacteria group bacterium]|nr:glycosyltransferase [Patescibacteria group bacterium]
MNNKKILLFGYYDLKSPRTYTIRKEYKNEGREILECHTEKNGFFPKCFDLRKQFKQHKKEVDEVVVLFPGHHLIPLAWLLTRFPRKKLTFDVFISVYDTLVTDRKKVSPINPLAWFYYLIDFFSCHLADEVLIDTQTHREFFIKKFKINPKHIRVVYLQAREDLFFPSPSPSPSPNPPVLSADEGSPNPSPSPNQQLETSNQKLNVFFYGSYIPLQGIDVILRAAKILQDKGSPVHFTLLGGGQTKSEMLKLAEKLFLKNVTFKEFAPIEELPKHINQADLCLGIFGTSIKAQRVIPHKVIDYRTCGKKVITERSPAILERYANDHDVILCEAGDAQDLAENILHCIG